MDGVGTSIVGRPRRLSADRRARPTYTLIWEEPRKAWQQARAAALQAHELNSPLGRHVSALRDARIAAWLKNGDQTAGHILAVAECAGMSAPRLAERFATAFTSRHGTKSLGIDSKPPWPFLSRASRLRPHGVRSGTPGRGLSAIRACLTTGNGWADQWFPPSRARLSRPSQRTPDACTTLAFPHCSLHGGTHGLPDREGCRRLPRPLTPHPLCLAPPPAGTAELPHGPSRSRHVPSGSPRRLGPRTGAGRLPLQPRPQPTQRPPVGAFRPLYHRLTQPPAP